MRQIRSSRCVVTAFVIALTIAAAGCKPKAEQSTPDEAQVSQAAQELADKVATLIQAARNACEQQQYPEALAKVDQILAVDSANPEATTLRAEIVLAQKLDQALPLKNKAEARWSKARVLSPDQGFAKSISSIETQINQANSDFDAANYDAAMANYAGVVADCDTLQELDKERKAAAALRDKSEQMLNRCKESDAETDAPTLWAEAMEYELNASTAFENAEFSNAQTVWRKAFTSFVEAERWAVGVQAVREVEKGYTDELGKAREEVNLDKFGGSAWRQTIDMMESSSRLVAEGKWHEAATAISNARNLLAEAVEKAKEERHRQAREFAVSRLAEALAKAQEQLVFAERTPRRSPDTGLPFIREGLAILAQCRNTSWYGILTETELGSIESLKNAILLERFHFLFPDLLAVSEPRAVSADGLAPGSQEAQTTQLKLASSYALPIEVRTRKSRILLRLIPAGSFIMGSRAKTLYAEPDETPHVVTISRPFYMGVMEISQRQWISMGMKNRSCFTETDSELPVENLSWQDARTYCDLLCMREIAPDGSYRLPTEAEWEYACRAGTQTAFYHEDSFDALDGVAWYAGNSANRTHPVGATMPNAWGLCDTVGNVWEWCLDSPAVYDSEAVTDPAGAADVFKAIRGGSWDEAARYCRAANRGLAQRAGVRSFDIGLRIVREIGNLPQ